MFDRKKAKTKTKSQYGSLRLDSGLEGNGKMSLGDYVVRASAKKVNVSEKGFSLTLNEYRSCVRFR